MAETNPPIAKLLKIVRLDGTHSPDPTFSPTFTHTYTSYLNTAFDTDLITSRIGDADIVISTRIPVSAATITACSNLKLIAVFAIGSDHVDLAACKERGMPVCNVPAASVEAVAEHAIALFFALRRNVVGMHQLTVGGEEWGKTGSLAGQFGGMPRTCREDVMGIFGAGELGNRVAAIGKALGMKVILADRKGLPNSSIRPGRVSFTTALQTSTVLMLTLPLSPETQSLIAAPEFALMRADALFINVARGGIVVEPDLVAALKEGKIARAATDVFSEEPAGMESVLVKAANEEWSRGRLVLTPHTAWFARSSIEKLRRTTAENIEAWARGEPRNLVL